MSFIKGNFYRCVDNKTVLGILAFTVGQVYKCLTNGVDMETVDDYGRIYICGAHRFDPTPVSQMSAAALGALYGPGAVTPATRHGHAAPPPVAPGGTPLCSCGKKAEKMVFSTFEYFYCKTCKKEVGGKAEAPSEKRAGLDNTISLKASTDDSNDWAVDAWTDLVKRSLGGS